MLPLETKQSGGKLLPHSDLRGGVFLEKVSRSSVAAGNATKVLHTRKSRPDNCDSRLHGTDRDYRRILRTTVARVKGYDCVTPNLP
jgi:hypothetical protein